ncbi:MAG: putative cupin superfamily sugar epimerase [Thalassolituus oleivorans]|jgi:predicted cupin superfamily sugar epimerase
MKPTALTEHPEGGRFQEVFRSSARVTTSSGRNRSAITHIYFSLNQGEVSRFHKVSSDEIWNLYKGSGIRIYTWDGTEKRPTCTELSAEANVFCHVVPAGVWQAAEPIGDSALVGCSVGPGFEFDDFQLMDPASDKANALQSLDPRMSKYTGP